MVQAAEEIRIDRLRDLPEGEPPEPVAVGISASRVLAP
jgi:hypothetical protein